MALEVSSLTVVAFAVHAGVTDFLAPALFALGFGQGIALPTLVRATIGKVEGNSAGLVAGLVSTALQVSAALSVAVIGGLFYRVLGNHPDPTTIAFAFTISTGAIALFLLAAAWLAFEPFT